METEERYGEYGDDAYEGGRDGSDGTGGDGTGGGEAYGAPERRGRGVDWPTVLAAGGVSAIISVLVLAIGLVGLLLSDVGARSEVAATPPTVVNLGAATAPVAAAPPAAAAPTGAESEAPAVEGDAPAAPNPDTSATDAQVPAASTPATAQPAAGPTAPTLGGFQSDLAVLSSGASRAEKGKRLEGGTAAVTPIESLFRLAEQFRATGLRYSLMGPVKQSGETATAQFKLTSPGYAPTYSTLRWVWKDGRWKLTNKSVCELAAYAQIPCNLR
ncbi:hypothetical protein [Gordonia alkaliphila]|uniref:Low molecular weight antigen MTB12-like C-terminal domain-containing protein n=1 Tax=Gordonia alkaliphila TaxID=1053547 RepID=A0ABP8ZFY1_9ACTN